MKFDNIKTYLGKQKIKVVEIYNFDKNRIKYTDKIKGWKIDKFRGDEEIVRAFILAKLVNELGYKPENIEIEKEYDIGRPKVNKPRIDVIVRDDEGNVFLYIELKSPQEFEKNKDEVIEKQLFNLASQEKGQGKKVKYLVLYTLELVEKEIKDKCILINYEKFTSFDSWKEIRNFADEIPARYGKAQKEPFVKGGKKDLETNFSHEQLESLRKNLHNVLWGGGGTDDNDIFSSLVNIILAKIQDESEKKKDQKYDFQIFSFKDGESFDTNEQLFERINQLYRRALKQRLNINDEKELKESYVIERKKFSLAKLKYTVWELEKYSFTKGKKLQKGKDILGEFFENIISTGFKQSKGQFFTHINIVNFLLWGLQLDKLAIKKINTDLEIPYLIDPSAGSGSFLIEYMKFITHNIKYRFKTKVEDSKNIQSFVQRNFYPDELENMWAEKFIYGSEINPNLGTSIKVNMILHGDGSANIFVGSSKGDGLSKFSKYLKISGENILNNSKDDEVYSKEVNESFDVIITNPPFNVSLDNDTKRSLDYSFIFGGKKNSENLFVERWYQLLKPNGRFGVVLPESIFDTEENKYIRIFIYKYFKVKAVVSLPQLTFEPFTSTKTSLLFAQKKTKRGIKEWDKLWAKYSNEWSNLKTRCENIVKVYIDNKNKKQYPSIKDLTENEEKDILKRMLKDYIEVDDRKLSSKELVAKFQDELKDISKGLFTKTKVSLKNMLGGYPANTWWVFGEVAKELNYKIFMAEVENVGYKRTTRGEKQMPNDLYRVDDKGNILIDDGKKETALDYLRDIKWD
ncbi:MAG: N-6 DNA methylase [Candidatus Cloacimonetes bacterium]|nr:N-6 DNA methylase [Candidatus Cloacimonadota bacterium]